MKRCKKSLFLLCFAMIGLSLIPLCFSDLSPNPILEKVKPNITFEQDITPFLTVTKNPTDNPNAFRFQWFNYRFDVNLHVNTTEIKPETIHNQHSLKSFTNKFNVTVNYLFAKEQNQTRFGWIIENVEKVTEKVNDVTFKINNTYPFSFKEITMEVLEIPNEPFNKTILHFPRNLALSFDDLREKGFSIDFQNETSTIIKGFGEKTKWDFDPIIYSSNIITAIGGSLGSELDFNDLYEADKAGTFQLLSTDCNPTETRWFKRSSHTINGLVAYKLETVDPIGIGVYPYLDGNATLLNGTWGIRVYSRNSSGNETELTPSTPVALVNRSAVGAGYQNGTWDCPLTSLNATDAIRVNFYLRIDPLMNWTSLQSLGLDWITEQLDAYNLVNDTWTIQYYTEIVLNAGVYRYILHCSVPIYAETKLFNFRSLSELNLTLTQQVRPTDATALKLNVTITNLLYNGNVTLRGLNIDGNTQTEVLSITANDTQTTTSWFSSITNLTCYGSYNLEINQGQWGVVWKQGGNQYLFDAKIVFGNNTVQGTTYFKENQKQIMFSDFLTSNWETYIELSKYTIVTFGELVDNGTKTTKNGVSFTSLESSVMHYFIYATSSIGTEHYLYSCSFAANRLAIIRIWAISGKARMWNCYVINKAYIVARVNVDYFNIHIQSPETFGIVYPNGVWDQVYITDATYALFFRYEHTISNLNVRGSSYIAEVHALSTSDVYLINAVSNTWAFAYSGTHNRSVYRQYSFDLTVTYPNGTAINGSATGARAVIQHYGNNSGVNYNETLNEDGTINQTVLTMGFYNRTGGNTIYGYSPFCVTVSNVTGFQTYMKNFTLSEKTDWTISLTQSVGSSAILLLACLIILPIIVVIGVFVVKWT